MKKEIFVFVSSDSVRICSENLKKMINYDEKGIRNITPDIIALIIRESLDELNLPDENVILALGSEYLSCTGKITSHVKKTYDQECATTDYIRRTISLVESSQDFVLRKSTRYICDGKSAPGFVAVPLLQKYFADRQCVEFETGFITRLLSELSKNEIGTKYLIAADSLQSTPEASTTEKKRQIALTFNKNQTIASVCEAGNITKTVSINFGLHKIAEDVSNNFNLSIKLATKLIELYGFVFLPKEYINYVIDVPIYGNVVQNIALTELSYCIRESLKEIYNGIMSVLSSKIRDYASDSFFICESSLSIKGMETLLKLTLNREVEFTSFDNVEYAKLQYIYNWLTEVDIEAKKEIIPETSQYIEPIVEVQVQPAIMERLSNLFNSRIKPLLLEADF
jgi:hypothetical protein